MAVVTYQCSTCKRQIDLVQNQPGLEWVGHCNITLGCRGTLFQVELHPDYTRGVPTPDVTGLKNWVQRKVLFNYTQAVSRKVWTITHNLGTAPAVVVYINQPTQDNPDNQVEILPQEIIYDTENQLTLIFLTAYSGIAQCIARSSNPDLLAPRPAPPVVTKPPVIQLSNQGVMTIATKVLTVGQAPEISLSLGYTLGSNTLTTDVTYTASSVPVNQSPWEDTASVVIKGKTYTVRTFNIQNAQTISGQIANSSWVQLLNINPTGSFEIPVTSVALAPTNQFVVSGNYELYFLENTIFQTIDTGTPSNNIPWVTVSSNYNPGTNETTITVSNDVTGSFAPTTKIVSTGIRQVEDGEVFILLGTPPFTVFDKVTSAYVDFTAVNTPATQFDIFIQGGNLFASTAIETTVYPPIRSVS